MKNNKENLWNDNQEPMDYYLNPPTPVELLGYAKNDIAEAQEAAGDLPPVLMEKLKTAYALLDGVQEYLFHKYPLPA